MDFMREKNTAEQTAKKNTAFFRIPQAVIILVLIATFVFSGLYMAQDFFMILPLQPGVSGYFDGQITNGFWLYLLYGTACWLLFELLMRIYFNYLSRQISILEKNRVFHILRYYFILRNILYGAVALIFYKYPLMIMFTETVIKPIITIGCCALFFMYFKRYVPKHHLGRTLTAMAMPLLGIYAALSILNIIMTVAV